MDNNQISYEEIDREIEARAASKKQRLPHDIFDFSELILVVIAVLLLLSTFLVRQTVVSGSSMDPTLKHGERLLISNLLYTPKAGDIVVLQVEEEIANRHSSLYKNEPIIKRVVATEGQTVSIVNGTVYIDGEALTEEYKRVPGPYDRADERANMAPVTISEGHIFVMGDNRGSSLDSRWFGEVDERTVIGKVILRFYPFSAFGGVR
ncbi:MAG: signal peptidase I [Clostridia bacterium]|nr:signal peptidase I [Clostridia bacterium]